jgi:hypothetical protein
VWSERRSGRSQCGVRRHDLHLTRIRSGQLSRIGEIADRGVPGREGPETAPSSGSILLPSSNPGAGCSRYFPRNTRNSQERDAVPARSAPAPTTEPALLGPCSRRWQRRPERPLCSRSRVRGTGNATGGSAAAERHFPPTTAQTTPMKADPCKVQVVPPHATSRASLSVLKPHSPNASTHWIERPIAARLQLISRRPRHPSLLFQSGALTLT